MSGGSRRTRSEVLDFLKKAYELVDDPSTDSLISWSPNGSSFLVFNPLECSRDLLTKRLQITNFTRFQAYGFKELVISSGQKLEFACNDFVRGKPDLLDKIADGYVEKLKEFIDRRYGVLKMATNREEYDLAIKEYNMQRQMERKKATRPTIPVLLADMTWRKDEIFDYLKKAYDLVDDPSTDSVISWAPNGCSFVVWKPLDCSSDLLPNYLQRFHIYGFKKVVISYAPGQVQLEFACTDFLRDQPTLLEKIADRYMEQLKATDYWAIIERVKNATNDEEYDLAIKEMFDRRNKDGNERMARMKIRHLQHESSSHLAI